VDTPRKQSKVLSIDGLRILGLKKNRLALARNCAASELTREVGGGFSMA
jgi:hypothetical protein